MSATNLLVIGSRDVTKVRDGISVYVDEVFSNFSAKSYSVTSIIVAEHREIRKRGNLVEVLLKVNSKGILEKIEYCIRVAIFLARKSTKNYDVFVLQGLSVAWLLPLIKICFKNSSLVIVNHSAEHLNESISFWKRYVSYLALFFLRFSDYSVAVSNYISRAINSSDMIRNGASYPIDNNGEIKCNKSLLFIGRLVEEKGIVDLVMKLDKMGSMINLVCISPVIDKKMREKLVNIYKNIVFFEALSKSEIFEHIAKCKLVVIPSFNEGFSLVSQEALNCGRLPLQRDLPALREFKCPDSSYFNDENFEERFLAMWENSETTVAPITSRRGWNEVRLEWEELLDRVRL
jgi:glycosyltransferase involved in cell wall biosynthesis